MTCDRCGAALTIGDWPFCPHGRGHGTAISDDIPGGQLIENLGPEPIRVYSESERRRLMHERGLRDFVRHVPGSPVTSNWDTPCATTLENARILVSRAAERQGHGDPDVTLDTLTMTVTEREDGFRVPPDGEPYVP
jgi:hypothetical protein